MPCPLAALETVPVSRARGALAHSAYLNLPIRVSQLNGLSAWLSALKYWFVIQNEQSSTGSTVIPDEFPHRKAKAVCTPVPFASVSSLRNVPAGSVASLPE